MIKKIYDHVKAYNLNPYMIGQYIGECEEKYLIVKEGVQMPSLSSRVIGQQVIDIILFVPINSYVELSGYKKDVINALKPFKGLRKTGFETPPIADDIKKCYTMSIEYVIQKKLEG